MSSETYYRFHWADAPTFNAGNAWSAPWGVTRTADGTSYECVTCDGTGEDRTDPICHRCDGDGCSRCDNGIDVKCRDCDGEGTIDCERGYSSMTSPEALVAYFNDPARSGVTASGAGMVVVFEGDWHDTGLDGEPTVVPTKVLETLTWDEFTARVNA